jgi:hypothetical protein
MPNWPRSASGRLLTDARRTELAEESAQDNFTDPDSRIMKRAGGGFDPRNARAVAATAF